MFKTGFSLVGSLLMSYGGLNNGPALAQSRP
jgi:hypothetical protein